ncbi:hypothetical protein PoB_003581500 [Plakobranchus ocellatus]|uniref:Uncharacterized protein n=1 Tax=Plakobranchus ocellatus TaxID=259542 RepID=A0AAV4AM79_9GAST|nr:hypothetical protein PoB_003581500 [Plakobranchus ocellatus]
MFVRPFYNILLNIDAQAIHKTETNSAKNNDMKMVERPSNMRGRPRPVPDEAQKTCPEYQCGVRNSERTKISSKQDSVPERGGGKGVEPGTDSNLARVVDSPVPGG